jgi:hypothetical protein
MFVFGLAAGITLSLGAARPSVASSPSYASVVAADTPSAWWRLGEAPGAGTATDASGHLWNGGYSGSGDKLGVAGGIAADSDTAMNVDGSQSGMYAPALITLSLTSFSVEEWVRTISPATASMPVAKATVGGAFDPTPVWEINVAANGTVQVLTSKVNNKNQSTGYTYVTPSSAAVDDGAWHHVVVAFSGTSTAIYVDGASVGGSTTVTSGTGVTGAYSMCTPPNNCPVESDFEFGPGFSGDLDEPAVYSHDLTAAQVLAHYQAGVAPPDTSNEPALSDTQASQAVSLATGDPRLATILGGASYTVGPVTPWTKSGGASTIGGAVEIDLAQPKDITADWPQYVYNDAEDTDPVYQTMVSHYTAPQVSSLIVSVDLNCGTVVGILPSPDDATGSDDSVVSGPVQPPACGDPTVNKAWVHNVKIISEGNSAFYNYEFLTADATKPDGPINMIVWGGNVFDKLQTSTAVGWGNGGFGTPGYGYVTDNFYNEPPSTPGYWDSDSGQKTSIGCHEDTHYRLWGRADGLPAPNNYWGYFYIGQAHEDIGDVPNNGIYNCKQALFGWYERAETRTATAWAAAFDANAVVSNHVPTLNSEGQALPARGYLDGNHWRGNNGLATKLQACFDNNGNRTGC